MLEERATGQVEVEVREHDDRSMQLIEYGLAIVAVAAAVLLAVVR
jgi:hypothetical protein